MDEKTRSVPTSGSGRRRRLAKSLAYRANALGATPVSPGSLLLRAARLRSRRDHDGLRKAVEGRVVLITGASSGIGRATALRMSDAGATTLLVARSEGPLQELATEIEARGGDAVVFRCDLTDYDEIDALITKILDQIGPVDIIVNNAGMSIRRKVRHSAGRFQDFERPMRLNYFAAVRLTMGLLPSMVERESGQIINISSWAALVRPGRFSGYSASKAALEAWSDCVQAEVLDDGVVFTNIHMPLVRTPMITPTKLYQRMPALTVDQAAEVVCDAAITRSRRVTPIAGVWARSAEALSPALGDAIRKNAP